MTTLALEGKARGIIMKGWKQKYLLEMCMCVCMCVFPIYSD